MVVHKRPCSRFFIIYHTPCGLDVERMDTHYCWQKVTCKRCLRTKAPFSHSLRNVGAGVSAAYRVDTEATSGVVKDNSGLESTTVEDSKRVESPHFNQRDVEGEER